LDFALYKSIEFGGGQHALDGQSLPMSIRRRGGCEVRDVRLMTGRVNSWRTHGTAVVPVSADADASYAQEYTLDITNLPPQIAVPPGFGKNRPIAKWRARDQQACIGSCANGRFGASPSRRKYSSRGSIATCVC
jgi:hypothetical protein